MTELAVILTIFDKILNVLGLIRDGKVQRDTKIDSFLYALYAALGETKSYITSLDVVGLFKLQNTGIFRSDYATGEFLLKVRKTEEFIFVNSLKYFFFQFFSPIKQEKLKEKIL